MFAPLIVPDPDDGRRDPKGRGVSAAGRAKGITRRTPDLEPGPGSHRAPEPDLGFEAQPDLGPIFELAEPARPPETLRETGPPSDGFRSAGPDAGSRPGSTRAAPSPTPDAPAGSTSSKPAARRGSGIGAGSDTGTDPGSSRDERARAVAEAINTALQGRVVRVGALADTRLPTVSSGFPALDRATGMEGFPRGRITEIIGRPTSGRGTVATRAVAAAGGYNAWVDVSGCLDVDYLARSGVDLDRLFVLRPQEAGDALGIAAHLMASGHFTLVVLDAVSDLARMTPSGLLGRELSRFTRVVTPALARTTTAALLLSGPEHHFRSLAHAATLRVALAQAGALRRGGVLRGWRARATVLKSPGLQGGESGLEVWLE